jgi:hypothetical protein
MVGVAGILGGALLSAIHGALFKTLFIKMEVHIPHFGRVFDLKFGNKFPEIGLFLPHFCTANVKKSAKMC